jgi:hypothetical protein
VFLGTPHRGSDVAFWGDMLARIAYVSLLNPASGYIKDLRNNSSLLMDVSEDFRSIASQYRIISFYEADKLPRINSVVLSGPASISPTYLSNAVLGSREAFRRHGARNK